MTTDTEDFKKSLAKLEELDAEFMAVGKEIGEYELLHADIFFISFLNRGLQLLHGFTLLVRNELFLAAAPLLRLQIDNCARLYAGSLVESVDDLTKQLLDGARLDRLTARTGDRLTDKYLVSELAKVSGADWLHGVYDRSSGYVHFSGSHLYAAATADSESRHLTLKISRKETTAPPALWLELIAAFTAATQLLLDLEQQWVWQKNSTRLAQRGGS